MSDRLAALQLFVRVARRGSFSSAARELSIAQSTASRTIAALEEEMGASLLVRNTRAVTLTEAGTEFLNRVEPLLIELEEAEHAARGTGELRGVLRVGLPSSLAVRMVIPLLPGFTNIHRELEIDLVMEDNRQDLVGEGVDVALRMGVLADSTAVARRIRSWPRLLVASPNYLKGMGKPKSPTDLSSHSVILGPNLNSHVQFERDGTKTSLRLEGKLKVGVNEGVVAAAVAGLGVALTSAGAVKAEIAAGKLVQVLEDWDVGSVDLSAVFASGKAAKRSARAFADYISAALQSV